ncbi:hypothetical protein COS33_00855 [Candidatus Wolfebacteria bacterium CG02_land_8_20_14_3_00_37_12]|uniref:LysM domain-containing protein n=2 Tax=Candidatus Wolfeibacteriota TaxID=1752735 RepID=A0A2M7CQK0_9BACT|nr:MAG: hypothetical protein COS33_00855 [Candidatus Wolfebacteria bacterium CG02_land_8_20_14_3_00_37_12]
MSLEKHTKEEGEIVYQSDDKPFTLAEKLKKAGLKSGEFEPKSLGADTAKEEKLEEKGEKIEEVIKPQEQKPFTYKNADDLIKASLGKDVFERPDKELEKLKSQSLGAAAAKEKKYYNSAIDKQIALMEGKLKNLENSPKIFNKVATLKQKEERQKSIEELKRGIEEAKLRKEAIEKAKAARDRVKNFSKSDEKKEIKIRTQVEADIAEDQPKTYGKIYAKESAPEDALEKERVLKNLKKQDGLGKEENNLINKIEIVSSVGARHLDEKQIKEAQEAREGLGKTREKIVESERIIELGDVHELIEPTPGEEILITEEEKRIEDGEKFLAATDKQEKKIEEEIKQEKYWIREKIEKTANWYKKQPFWKKAVFSIGCIGVASASASISGAIGAAIASAAFTGSISQRAIGGLATFITAEGLLKKSAEKGGKERTKAEATRHTIEAAVLGLLVGSGQAARGVKEIADVTGVSDLLKSAYEYWIPKSWVESLDKIKYPHASSEPKIAAVSEVSQEVPQEVLPSAPKFQIADNVGIKKGDSIWSVAKRYLESNDEFQKLGGANAKVTEALQTYNIDRVKDVILANPEKYGLVAGIDMQDLTKLSVDDLKNIKWGEALNDSIQEKGGLLANLPQEKIDSIVQNNSTLREFFKENSDAPRTVENYEDILRGGGNTGIIKPVEEITPDVKEIESPESEIEPQEKPKVEFKEMKDFFENKAKIDIGKSSWLTEKFLENHKVGEILDSGFAKPQGVEMYTTAESEWGSPQWWEIKEKGDFKGQVEKILRNIPIEERAEIKKTSLFEFLEKYLAK